MSHVDEGVLQALMDGELHDDARRSVDRHLAVCDACQGELDSLRKASREFSQALTMLESPQTGRRAAPLPRRPPSSQRRFWLPGRALARAAVLVLGFTGAAAAASLPGSPVRAWLDENFGSQAGASSDADDVPSTAVLAVDDRVGVSVQPSQGEVRVVLRGAEPELRVRVRLAEASRAGVFASGAAADARFSTGPGRIEVDRIGPGELWVELPREVPRATVVVNGEPYITKTGEQLRLLVPAADSAGTEVSFRVQP